MDPNQTRIVLEVLGVADTLNAFAEKFISILQSDASGPVTDAGKILDGFTVERKQGTKDFFLHSALGTLAARQKLRQNTQGTTPTLSLHYLFVREGQVPDKDVGVFDFEICAQGYTSLPAPCDTLHVKLQSADADSFRRHFFGAVVLANLERLPGV